jgi:GNAT superfamily N-acetyltransferase
MSDWPAVRRISAEIWEGRDYVPLFFKQWVREGGFWCAETRGRVAGYGKATELATGEWWLEGLRVDPALRRRGIGAELSRQVLYQALNRRPVSLRLATADVNRESVRIIETVMHFNLLAQLRMFRAEAMDAKEGEPLVVPSARAALEFIRAEGELGASKGLLQSTWRFRNADARYLAELKRAGRLLGYERRGRLEGVLVCGPHRYRAADLDVSFVGGSMPALTVFRAYLHRRVRAAGGDTINGMAASAEMAAALAAVGAEPSDRIDAVLVYDYPV